MPHTRRTLLSSLVATSLIGTTGPAIAIVSGKVGQGKAARPAKARGQAFATRFDDRGLRSLRFANDAYDTDYIAPGQSLGHLALTFRTREDAWIRIATDGLQPIKASLSTGGQTRSYTIRQGDVHLQLDITIMPTASGLRLSYHLKNLSAAPVEIGDFAVPLPMHTQFTSGQPATAAVLKHSFISGDGSFLFWMRSNSAGPYLVMTPEHGTHLEYWDRQSEKQASGDGEPSVYRAYVHADHAAGVTHAEGCTWRQPTSRLTLAPGTDKTYGFRFAWAQDYDHVRDTLVEAGLLDILVAPGMTVPSDLATRIAIRSHETIDGIDAEHPDATTIIARGMHSGRHIYDVRFRRLGENRLTVRHGGGRKTHLEFFATEPVETMIHKRAAFIARHQHRDPSRWYNGLFGEWNMASQTLLGPDNYDHITGWRIYEVTCDDPGLSKPAYLASKNAEFPVQSEISALDDYITHFVWGGLQRTTEETYSYGIYGIPDWKTNRGSADPGSKGKLHIWRCYDYPHIIVMYYAMARIAATYPGIATALTAGQYLERAGRTALAMFTIPLEIAQWSAYETGFYNECVIPDLIGDLERGGLADLAKTLDGHWQRKVAFFVTGAPDLFGSEYAFDSTGFESTQALARSALDSGLPAAKAFSRTQMAANLFCRGVIEPAYYYLGSDYRAQGGDSFTLTYMAQMGGGAVLDYSLHDAEDPAPYIRLGITSALSAWALLNSGTAQSNYGYWYPGQANDGGAGGGFEPAPSGKTWLNQPHHRGSWYYSCEIDLGFCGALRSAATIISDDPVFGRFCFGGDMHSDGATSSVVPKDGVRRRLHVRDGQHRLDLHLDGGRFAAGQAIRLDNDLSTIRFWLEREGANASNAVVHLMLARGGPVALTVAGDRTEVLLTAGKASRISLPVPASDGPVEIVITRA